MTHWEENTGSHKPSCEDTSQSDQHLGFQSQPPRLVLPTSKYDEFIDVNKL